MKLSSLIPYLIHEFKSESDLLKAIEEISLKFTKERHKIGDYLKDPRLVSAYTAFYFLTNLPKLSEVFKWLPKDWLHELEACDFVDLGAGPGTFSFSWMEMSKVKGDFYQVEMSPLMREQAKKLWEGFHQRKLYQSSKWEWTTEKPRFLLFGHSANEMELETILGYIQKINPEHILFIEPGTKDFFSKMLSIREALLKQSYSILYPCPNAESCPMEKTSDWCHQFIQVKQDEEVERLSQIVRKDRKLLPLTVQAFSRTFNSANPRERLVRVLPETKFSFEWEVCHMNQLEHYQVMKRDLQKSDVKALTQILAGATLETELIKALENSKRVKIKSVK